MKIAYIYQFLTLGGVCAQIRNRIAYFREQDVETCCFFLYDRGGLPLLGDRTDVVVERRSSVLADRALASGADVVVTIDTPQVHRYLERRSPRAWINEVHTTTSIASYVKRLGRYPSLAGCIVPSEYMRSLLQERSTLAADRIEVVGNCIDTEKFAAVRVKPRPASPIVCWIGKLDLHKNWREFLAIAGRLAGADAAPGFWLVGGANATVGTTRQLVQSVNGSAIASRFAWMDRIEYEAMPRLYSLVAGSGGLLVITSTNESFGMTAAEAMCCGCPVVASRVGALPELVDEGHSGLLYSLGDTDAATRACALMLRDTAFRDSCIAAARARVVQRHGLQTVGARYLEALERLTA